MKTKAFLPALILATLFTSLNRSEKNHFTLFDFTNGADISQWYVLNDDVMGGISTSELIINEDGHGAFSGTVSTENYGGFASIRYQMGRTNTRKASHIRFRIKGDGKDYQIRIKPNSSDMHSYIKSFSTNSKWETITIKLNDLYPSFRGRKLNLPNFDQAFIEELSFLIANKKNESFQLLIDRVELINN